MPFAKWPDFDACVNEQLEKGHSEDSARRICGAIKNRVEGNAQEVQLNADESKYIDEVMKPESVEVKNFESLDNVEIFAVGTWNKDKYTTKDLNEMTENFVKLRDVVKPYAKIGHSEEQKLLKSEGLPAAGWVDTIKMVGNRIVATFKDVPKVVKELIDKKAYKRVSAEIYPKYKNPADGKIYRNVLRAVAFLGAETPAVETLSDIKSLYSAKSDPNGTDFKVYSINVENFNNSIGGEIVGKYRVNINGIEKEALVKKLSDALGENVQVEVADNTSISEEEEQKLKDKEIKDKKIEELTQQYEAVSKLQGEKDSKIAELNAKIAELEKERDMLKGNAEEFKKKTECVQKDFDEQSKQWDTYKKEQKDEKIKTFVKQQIEEGRILPKDEPIVVALMGQLDDKAVLKFTKEGTETEESMLNVLKTFISELPKKVDFNEISLQVEHKVYDKQVSIGGVNYEVKDIELVQKAEKYAQDNKVAFDVALMEVSKEQNQ